MTRTALAALAATALLVVTAVPATAAVKDRDGDGLRDKWEKRYGLTSPTKRDTDGDGVVDSAEDLDGDRLGNLGEQRWATHPGKKDTDGDGKPDGAEDKNRNGISNAREQDRRRVPAGVKPSVNKAKWDVPLARKRCMTVERSSKLTRCWYGPKDSETRIAFMGDSHAVMWVPAVKNIARRRGWRTVTLLKGGCSPLLGTLSRHGYKIDKGRSCRAWRKAAYAWLAKSRIDLLVITHTDSYRLLDARGNLLKGQDRIDAWHAGAKKSIAAMPDPGRVVLMGDVPHNKGNPVKCLAKSRSNISRCVSPKESLASRTVERAFRQAAADKGAQFDTLYDQICSYDPCPLVQGNVLMWRDRHHLTATFTARLAPSLKRLFKAGLARAAEEPAGR